MCVVAVNRRGGLCVVVKGLLGGFSLEGHFLFLAAGFCECCDQEAGDVPGVTGTSHCCLEERRRYHRVYRVSSVLLFFSSRGCCLDQPCFMKACSPTGCYRDMTFVPPRVLYDDKTVYIHIFVTKAGV